MSKWTVKPTTRTIPLMTPDLPGIPPEPFEIVVARRLSIGEERAVITGGWRGMSGTHGSGEDARIDIDWQRQTFARTMAYVKDWTLKEDDGAKLPLNSDTVKSLHPELFSVIENAITEHIALMDEEKKVPNGSSKPEPTSA